MAFLYGNVFRDYLRVLLEIFAIFINFKQRYGFEICYKLFIFIVNFLWYFE